MNDRIQETIALAVDIAFRDLSMAQVNELVMDSYLEIRETMQSSLLVA